jgi:restriction system protein
MISTEAPIDPSPPKTWQDLQDKVKGLYSECGWIATTEEELNTARGSVIVDVLARDERQTPPLTVICECKCWRRRVPRNVVHSLRTVISDYGANWGILISSRGFQKGAFEATAHSNLKLLGWSEFEEMLRPSWIREFMIPTFYKRTDPLVEYTEFLNSRIFKKADRLPEASRLKFKELRAKYLPLSVMLSPLHPAFPGPPVELLLPLRLRVVGSAIDASEVAVPDGVLDAGSLRGLLEAYLLGVDSAIAEFDDVFGERA